MPNVFQFNNYREILKKSLLERKERLGRTFTFAKMAKACRLQRTYLSTVLGGEGHLNADQVFEAAQFLKLTEDEYRYLSAMHEYERSVCESRKRRLQREIEIQRAKGLRTESYVEAPALSGPSMPSGLTDFYLDINSQLIHMFLTVKHFGRDLERTRRALNLGRDIFQSALSKIERAGLVRIKSTGVEIIKDAFHLSSTSELYPAYRIMMRLKALEMLQARGGERQFSFSALYSANEETRPRIQSRFLEFVDWAQKLTQSDEPTDIFQMNFDLVKWSDES